MPDAAQGTPLTDGASEALDVYYSVEQWSPKFLLTGGIVAGRTYTFRRVHVW